MEQSLPTILPQDKPLIPACLHPNIGSGHIELVCPVLLVQPHINSLTLLLYDTTILLRRCTIDTEEQLRRELTEWIVKSVKTHKRIVSLLPISGHIRDLAEPSSWIFNEELFAEFDKAKKEEETASAKIHEIMDKLSKIREK